ncbi:glycosyl hydrolase family 76-domain-containing protein [Lipomyces arxii]|uniref:glycosyl hydrolase family 76-domain-containing protein n=1 Tax=Lipomyces arxii TaxID=56418 RepID=UPI0034D0003B
MRFAKSLSTTILVVSSSFRFVLANGIELDLSNQDSIKSGARIVADGLMNYYNGNQSGQVPGLFAGGYYWWECGAAWGSMLDYWFYTGDTTYSDVLKEALIFQVGQDWDYMPSNQTLSLGNDDQGFWGITVMAAAERNFTNPDTDQPQWLALAQAVFNSIALVWDTEACQGGVRWQKFVFNHGYDYKNSISNGLLFQLGARLARYTRNETYADWTEKVWEWETQIGMIDGNSYYVYDGASANDDCTNINKIQWTYNMAVFLAGSAYMYNYTESDVWKSRVDGLITTLTTFLYQDTNIIYEPACEPSNACNVDQRSFKAYMSRWLGLTTQMAPYTHDTLFPVLIASATAAAATCNGGLDGVTCGYTWLTGTYDGSFGLGEQMAALEAIQSQLIPFSVAPYTDSNGGSSPGDASLGTHHVIVVDTKAITTKDKAGAWIVTVIVGCAVLLTTIWVGMEGDESTNPLKQWIRVNDS